MTFQIHSKGPYPLVHVSWEVLGGFEMDTSSDVICELEVGKKFAFFEAIVLNDTKTSICSVLEMGFKNHC